MKNFLLAVWVWLLESWVMILAASFMAVFVFAFDASRDEAKKYTKACNEQGGIALKADSPSMRQCMKTGAAIIINP